MHMYVRTQAVMWCAAIRGAWGLVEGQSKKGSTALKGHEKALDWLGGLGKGAVTSGKEALGDAVTSGKEAFGKVAHYASKKSKK